MHGGTVARQRTLGRYVVVKHLAQGGMADVLLARSSGIEGFERYVVIKRIRADVARDARYVSMFLDEARLAASLHHHNIIGVNDIGEENGEYFFAMEYLHGEDVRRLLTEVSKKGERVPLEHAITIVTAAAAGLHHAHEQRGADRKPLGIVHRDVSPANILIGYDGSVKVADFGIAKAEQRSTETRTGTLKGKIAYMSPEQCVGDEVDRRSDVFSLGIVLYELVTTRRLFKDDNDFLTMTAIVHGNISPPSKYRPDLPPALEAIILKALAKNRDDRYATADELRIALEQFANEAGISRSSTALADYLKEQFGTRPEPWLDDEDEPEIEMTVDFDGSASGAARPPIDAAGAIDPVTGERSDAPIARARRNAITASLAPASARQRPTAVSVATEPPAASISSARRRRHWWLALAAACVAALGLALAIVPGEHAAAVATPDEHAITTPDERAVRAPARVPPAHLPPAAAASVEQLSSAAPAAAVELAAAPTAHLGAEPAASNAHLEIEPAASPDVEAPRERTVRPPAKKRVAPARKRARKAASTEHWDPRALFPE